MMRRKEKEITNRTEIDAIIHQAEICRLALMDGDIPYIVPVNYGYDGKCLYIHSAPEGRKIHALQSDNLVCFQMDVDVEIVETESVHKCSTKYRSVIGYGRAVIVEDDRGKKHGLDVLMKRYSNIAHEYPQDLLDKMVIIRIDIENVTGKKSD